MNPRYLFLQHLAQTSDSPLCFEIEKASGVFLYDVNGKKYFDAIGGISVANVGHACPHVLKAMEHQMRQYLHVMVYGEMVQSPQVRFAEKLIQHLPDRLNNVYFTNSGAEAIEGAMKLAKRYTGRSKIIAFEHSYHGSTQGALSLIGDEYFRTAYRPLLPEVYHYPYNQPAVFEAITSDVACVVLELVQAESGVTAAEVGWVTQLAELCKEKGVLLIVDESQTGFGRIGSLWASTVYNVVPDVLVLAKAVGGGLPLGAFIANRSLMQVLTHNPILGHLTTFGGHPLSCASGEAALDFLLSSACIEEVSEKETILKKMLQHPAIEKTQIRGLWAALFFKDFESNQQVVQACIKNGVFTDYFLFASNALRISPPLIISTNELEQMCKLIIQSVDEALA